MILNLEKEVKSIKQETKKKIFLVYILRQSILIVLSTNS